MTKVKFYKESDKEVLAYFPDEHFFHAEHPDYNTVFTCYAHLGQHSSCSKEYVKGKRLATPEQYADLLNELKGQGYDDLIILNKPRTKKENV